MDIFSRSDALYRHSKVCFEKNDAVRCLEIQLDKYIKKVKKNECRFCDKIFNQNSNCTRHLKSCKKKQLYREQLENEIKQKNTQEINITNNNITNNNNTINVLNVSAETLRKFGQESTDHITNAYLRKVIGRLGVQLPTVVSTVAKEIYCNKAVPENDTIQITNIRSQWAKISNGSSYELQPLGDSVNGIRNKITDLYVERQCDEPDYFKKVEARIDKLDDLNNQNYTSTTLAEKEDKKQASKLKAEIEREIKSTLYNLHKAGKLVIV